MSGNFEEDERINLALTSEFDSAFLNCLEDGEGAENDDTLGGETSDFSQSPARPSSPVGGAMHRLPSFLMNDGGEGDASNSGNNSNNLRDSSTTMNDGAPSQDNPSLQQVAGAGLPNSSLNNSSDNNNVTLPVMLGNVATTQMHPLAISSSATCPPVNGFVDNVGVVGNAPAVPNVNIPGPSDPNVTAALQAAFAASIMQLNTTPAFNPALIPLAFNAMSAGVDLSNFLPQFQANFAANAPSVAQPVDNAVAPPPISTVTAGKPTSKKNKSGGRNSKRRRSGNSSSLSSNKRPKGSRGQGQQDQQQQEQPPFHIFDAPVELRQNFIQAQRSHGLPLLEDDNSYHFGVAVNGFHPQRLLEEPFLYRSLTSKGRPLPDPVPVIDARHADAGSKRLKNAKEQKRAHRISELIDQLRVKMEKGGWKVGIKSKFHTLSSCSDYVRHLIKVNQEKEAALEKARQDLAAKKAKMDEEKRTQQDPSEPESTTSSLTGSSQSEKDSKKKSPGLSVDAKQAIPSFSLRATSAVSDITDSKKDGSSSEDGNRKVGESNDSDETVSSDMAVSSVGGAKSPARSLERSAVAATNKSVSETITSTASEKTSLDTDFELDYEEVFVNSNVPQLLAATNGRIVSFNDFFLKVSGLSRKEVESLTIFSLVKVSLLSNLFEIVAAALRSSMETEEKTSNSRVEEKSEKQDDNEPKLAPLKDYAAMTLPCVDFASIFGDDRGSAATPNTSVPKRQLYMTVTLMTDKDVQKRCFHCAFTDCPGTGGALGTVTPELLSALFSGSQSTQAKDDPQAQATS